LQSAWISILLFEKRLKIERLRAFAKPLEDILK
jgi:hypothetical protein